ncbi:hypothetical protein HPB52_009617 [Rhipicephalus sanguineus]|uniref:Endonuclease/exonuclease/phosphatase domain-containing protein n=1 Tax=Rhipicephalus sanguineus TaxID=34632 RepID=A0A9D4T3B8_RHISA|nr:hypothetical protein HPB52_009617 [Rhipicephalus sanguineus]
MGCEDGASFRSIKSRVRVVVAICVGVGGVRIVRAYIRPGFKCCTSELAPLSPLCGPRQVLVGDFSAHNPEWGSECIHQQGVDVAYIASTYELEVLNSGECTFRTT